MLALLTRRHNKKFVPTAYGTFYLLVMALMSLTISTVAFAEESPSEFTTAIENLKNNSFRKKSEAVEKLTTIKDPRILKVFQALLHGNLYIKKADKSIVIATVSGQNYRIADVLTGKDLGNIDKYQISKIIVNNLLRSQLREAIAHLSLSSDDPGIRLAAVTEMIKNIDTNSAATLRETLKSEKNKKVRGAIQTALALVEIDSTDKAVRLKAVETLSESIIPETRNQLAALVKQESDGSYTEPDADIRNAANIALKAINSTLQFYKLLETIFFGFSLGSVLLLAAIGLAITFGVMGVINMAHGELMMLGAYTTYVVQLLMPNYIDYSLFVAIPTAFLISGMAGIAIERGVIRFLYGRPLETLLATFGLSLILQQLVRTIFSPLNRSVETPSWMSGSLEINSALSLTYNRLYIVIFSLMVFFALLLILKKTSLGLQVRAVSQNRAMAKAMGIRTEWVDALTFGLGSGIAGVAGVALSQLTNVGPNLGQSYIIDSFMVVVFGGVGNLWGTLVGAFSLGVGNKFLEPWSGAVMAKILVLVFIILFIQKRPRGLFPQKGRAAEN